MTRDSERDGSREVFAPLDELSESLVKTGRRRLSGPSAQVQWESFAAKMSLVAGGLEPLSGVHTRHDASNLTKSEQAAARPQDSMRVQPEQGAAPGAAVHSPKLGLVWGGMGAILGGLLVFAWGEVREKPQTQLSPVAAPSSPDGAASPSPTVSTTEGVLSQGAALRQKTVSPSADDLPVRKESPQSLSKESRRPAHEDALHSTLSEEVQLLHKARQAAPGRALEIISDFQRRFPKSALTADSEVVALGAIERLGRARELKRRAESFLRKYPGDPHINRVRSYLTDK